MVEEDQVYDRIIADGTEVLDSSLRDAIALTKRGRAWCEKRNYGKAIADFVNALSGRSEMTNAT